jgi:hypothetical protein
MMVMNTLNGVSDILLICNGDVTVRQLQLSVNNYA